MALDNGGGGGAYSSSLGSSFTKGITAAAKTATSTIKKPAAKASSGYHAPTPPRYPAPRPAVGNNSMGRVAPASPPPAPKPMSPDQWLANDVSYKSQRAAYEDALRDYSTQYTGEQNKYNTEFAANQQKMATDRTQAQTGLTDDYASRGLMNSGVYGDALNTFQSEWDTKGADMERAKQAYMNDLLTGKTNYEKEQGLYLEKAKQDALNRMSTGIRV